MAKTLEEFFIQQIEAKEEEIRVLNDKIKGLNACIFDLEKDKDILICGLRAFGFVIEECALTCTSEIHFGKNDVKAPARFLADFNRLRDYFEDHYIVEANGRVELKGDL